MTTYTLSSTFTKTHAQHIAGRITSDLRHSRTFYGNPTEERLEQYRLELEELLFGHYVSEYHFGFNRGETLVWALRYRLGADGNLDTESSLAGGIPVGHVVEGAEFFNFLTFSSAWFALSQLERQAIQRKLPFERAYGTLPGQGSESWVEDRRFAAGGVAAQRAAFGGKS